MARLWRTTGGDAIAAFLGEGTRPSATPGEPRATSYALQVCCNGLLVMQSLSSCSGFNELIQLALPLTGICTVHIMLLARGVSLNLLASPLIHFLSLQCWYRKNRHADWFRFIVARSQGHQRLGPVRICLEDERVSQWNGPNRGMFNDAMSTFCMFSRAYCCVRHWK